MKITPEGIVKAKVKTLLNAVNAYWFMPTTAGYGVSGSLDFSVCLNSRAIFIECKADETNKPTYLQNTCADRIFLSGGLALLIHAGNMAVLERCLEQISRDAGARFNRQELWPIDGTSTSGRQSSEVGVRLRVRKP